MNLQFSPTGKQNILMPNQKAEVISLPNTPEIALIPNIFKFLGAGDTSHDAMLYGSKGREMLLGSRFQRSTEKSDIDFCTTYKGSEDDLRHWRKEILSFLRIEKKRRKNTISQRSMSLYLWTHLLY